MKTMSKKRIELVHIGATLGIITTVAIHIASSILNLNIKYFSLISFESLIFSSIYFVILLFFSTYIIGKIRFEHLILGMKQKNLMNQIMWLSIPSFVTLYCSDIFIYIIDNIFSNRNDLKTTEIFFLPVSIRIIVFNIASLVASCLISHLYLSKKKIF